MRPESCVPLAVADRSGLDESVHHGVLIALDRSGRVALALGDVDDVVYPRSSNKPMQAVAMVRLGLTLPDHLLALVCASHDGLAMHRRGALDILGSAGLAEADLGNTPDYPLDPAEHEAVVRGGGRPTALQQNCSGKHAGMLATCVLHGWDRTGYLAFDHPLQVAITETMAELIGADPAHIGVDGCGAPAHAMTLRQLALGVRAIATGAAGPSSVSVASAMRAAPQMVGGPTSEASQMMESIPGLIAKEGAEGVFVAALDDGRAVAMKIGDGAGRARPAVMLDALARIGVDVGDLPQRLQRIVRGHGQPVGRVRSLV